MAIAVSGFRHTPEWCYIVIPTAFRCGCFFFTTSTGSLALLSLRLYLTETQMRCIFTRRGDLLYPLGLAATYNFVQCANLVTWSSFQGFSEGLGGSVKVPSGASSSPFVFELGWKWAERGEVDPSSQNSTSPPGLRVPRFTRLPFSRTRSSRVTDLSEKMFM